MFLDIAKAKKVLSVWHFQLSPCSDFQLRYCSAPSTTTRTSYLLYLSMTTSMVKTSMT